jgi:hypothetical protein
MIRTRTVVATLLMAVVAGCGSSKPSSTSSGSNGNSGSPGALSAEAQSAATGDIPDNQNFLTYKGTGYTMSYPEGWAQTGKGGDVSFRDKNNVVHVAITASPTPTVKNVTAALANERARTPSLRAGTPRPVQLKGGGAIKVTYTTIGKPNPVTGKRVKLSVDRYVLGNRHRTATIDLGTPVGVDNVDAYRLMANSFHWR